MKKNIYQHNIDLEKIEIKNSNRDDFRNKLITILKTIKKTHAV